MSGAHRAPRARLWILAGLWTLLGLGGGLLAAARGPALLGHTTLTVMSGSMEPAISTGDLVVGERISPREARIGDVVTFQDPSRSARLITHRVRSLRVDGGMVEVTTRGDANTASESWSAPAEGEIGRVMYRIPAAGYFVHWMAGPAGRLSLVVAPAVILALMLLVRIWRPRPIQAAS